VHWGAFFQILVHRRMFFNLRLQIPPRETIFFCFWFEWGSTLGELVCSPFRWFGSVLDSITLDSPFACDFFLFSFIVFGALSVYNVFLWPFAHCHDWWSFDLLALLSVDVFPFFFFWFAPGILCLLCQMSNYSHSDDSLLRWCLHRSGCDPLHCMAIVVP